LIGHGQVYSKITRTAAAILHWRAVYQLHQPLGLGFRHPGGHNLDCVLHLEIGIFAVRDDEQQFMEIFASGVIVGKGGAATPAQQLANVAEP
jgi:hypothetical protein